MELDFEEIEPFYHILVIAKFKNQYDWYLTTKDCWILDKKKYAKAFISLGMTINDEFVDFDSQEFLTNLAEYKVDINELKHLIKKEYKGKNWDRWEFYHVFPQLFADFDAQHLHNMYPEPFPFEKYLPNGWTESEDVYWGIEIPDKFKYWLIEGKDYFFELR